VPPSAEVDLRSTSDPLLADYLEANDSATRDDALRTLLERDAAPIIRGVLQRKQSNGAEEDVTSAAREQLIRQLGALRSGERQTPIRDFRSYVAGVAYSAWADHLRNEHPERSALLNRIRYLLENRTAEKGFALWETPNARKWCGFPEWVTGEPKTPTPKLQWLLSDPVLAARQAFGNRYWQRNELSTLVADLFRWLETPIELRDLVFVVAEILEMAGRNEPVETQLEDERVTGTYPSAAEELIWKEYLLWLWRQLTQLSARQCAAFLLNSGVLRDFELLGIASIRSLAPRFGMTAEHLAQVWQRLPLDDREIAGELNCERQQVINLRRVARDTLSRAWQEFSGNTTGNKMRDLASSRS
jgi:DNA-directed RNA polymerase specialized sigma24 family protein